MIQLRHLVQDLRAEAPNASPEHAQLMRQAAAELEQQLLILVDGTPGPAPIPPPPDLVDGGRH